MKIRLQIEVFNEHTFRIKWVLRKFWWKFKRCKITVIIFSENVLENILENVFRIVGNFLFNRFIIDLQWILRWTQFFEKKINVRFFGKRCCVQVKKKMKREKWKNRKKNRSLSAGLLDENNVFMLPSCHKTVFEIPLPRYHTIPPMSTFIPLRISTARCTRTPPVRIVWHRYTQTPHNYATPFQKTGNGTYLLP